MNTQNTEKKSTRRKPDRRTYVAKLSNGKPFWYGSRSECEKRLGKSKGTVSVVLEGAAP